MLHLGGSCCDDRDGRDSMRDSSLRRSVVRVLAQPIGKPGIQGPNDVFCRSLVFQRPKVTLGCLFPVF
jgi:hypothetical protein